MFVFLLFRYIFFRIIIKCFLFFYIMIEFIPSKWEQKFVISIADQIIIKNRIIMLKKTLCTKYATDHRTYINVYL